MTRSRWICQCGNSMPNTLFSLPVASRELSGRAAGSGYSLSQSAYRSGREFQRQPEPRRIFHHEFRVVVPRGLAGGDQVIDAVGRGETLREMRDQTHAQRSHVGDELRRGRRPDLVGDDFEFVAFPGEAQNGLREVAAARRVKPSWS